MKENSCFCGSGNSLSQCCRRVMEHHELAEDPETLMRSRYSAFVMRDANHLLRTWDSSTRPKSLEFDEGTQWLSLEIHDAALQTDDMNRGKVRFTASIRVSNELYTMTETSSFRRRNGLWYYVDGENKTERSTINKKAACPCGSGKKFKRCCME